MRTEHRGVGALVACALCLAQPLARADEAPPLVAPPPLAPAARLRTALERFEFGDYAAVIAELESLVETGAHELPPADRLEALRAYGISCALTGRATAAEGAFLLLLEADANARLDVAMVRPEAVALFESVRTRRNATLLSAYRKGKGRRYIVLNFIPPAGQFQNRQYGKAYTLLALELSLLATNITSGSLLYAWRGENQDFPGHESAARLLRPLNWVSFGVLVSCVIYGVIDGLVVGRRMSADERQVEQRLSARRTVLDPSAPGLGIRF